MLTVTKFGGSSLASSEQFKKVKSIIDSSPSRKVVIVSAPGKREIRDNKITDLLYLTYSHLKYHVDYSNVFNLIKERFYEIENSLSLDVDLDNEFMKLEKKMKEGISEEELVSRGEYFNAMLMASYLGYKFIDSKDVIFFNYDGSVNVKKSLDAIKAAYNTYEKIVISGFYGSYPDNTICLFSRGGSDVTASYVSLALEADKYENWTDVSGFYMADPKIVNNPRHIKEVSYDELRELSYMGASVLHEETILPLIDTNIPLEILNTNHPDEEGTIITSKCKDTSSLITGITGKKDFIGLTIVKRRNASKLKAMMDTLKILDKYHIEVEHIPSAIDSFTLVIAKDKVEKVFFDIFTELKSLESIMSVSYDEDIALVTVVGRNMVTRPGISGQIMSVFGNEKINIKIIDQSRDEINIIVGVSNSDFAKSIKCLYNEFSK